MTVARSFGARVRRLTRSRPFLFGTAAVLLAVAVLAALLAQDVRSWRDTLRDDAIRYSVSPAAQQQWTAPTILPAGLSARLLGVAPDRRRLSALRFFALANAIDFSNGITPRTKLLLQAAEVSLSRAAADPNPARASQAYTLLGVLLLSDADSSAEVVNVATYAAAVSAMQNAVRVNPDDAHARANLELLLRQLQADSSPGSERQANNQGSRQKGKTVGRGKGVPPLNAPGGDY
jgi:hypothetical protein